MAPFTRWLPASPERSSDLVIEEVGDGRTDLAKGAIAFEQALADQGYYVMAQSHRLDGIGPTSSIRLRVSLDQVCSMGSGCDVLLYLGLKLPAQNPFHLQRGSVLIADERCIHTALPHAIPEGVITYAMPFAHLPQRHSDGSEKGIFAIGLLTQFLGFPAEAVRRRVEPEYNRRHFEEGLTWAAKHLHKHDIYALAPQPDHARQQVLLNARQVIGLGLEVGSCGCGPGCVQSLHRSPETWIAEHVDGYWSEVLSPRSGPAADAYQRSERNLLVLLGVEDPTRLASPKGKRGKEPLVVVPADLPDALRLLVAARRLVRTDLPVWIVLDTIVTHYVQAIEVKTIAEVVSEAEQFARNDEQSRTPVPALLHQAEREGETDADVGFVTWGASQGVVREAVALCRNFGLRVAALYPKVLRPPPTDDLRAFSATVKRLIVVEPDRAMPYTRLIAATTSLRPASIVPEPGQPLTPMDIFLREDLGGCTPAKTQ
jgi:hypothetical protein